MSQPIRWSNHPSSPSLDPSSPEGIAIIILGKLAALDSTAPTPSEIVLRTWADMIAASRLELPDLEGGLMRVYSGGGDVPKNKLGAIMREAKNIRRDRISRLPQAPSSPPARAWGSGKPVQAAYAAHGALNRACTQCGAAPGDWCSDAGELRKIPHWSRLSRRSANG